MKKISVIIPVYNTKEFLNEGVESLLNQSYKNIELIFVNDYSNDGSKEELEKFKEVDERIKVFHLPERKGVGYARNFGMKKAIGDYLYFLDSDDFLKNNTLQLLMENIKEFSIITGKIHAAHSIFKTNDQKEENTEFYIEKRTFDKESVLNCLISREFVEKNNFAFSEEVECFSEYPFITSLISRVSVFPHVEEAVYYKRKRNDPISNPALFQENDGQIIKDFLQVYLSYKEKFKGNDVVENYLDEKWLDRYQKTISSYFVNENNIDEMFSNLVKAIQQTKKTNIEKCRYFIKRELNVLKKGQLSPYKKALRTHRKLRKAKAMTTGRTKLFLQLQESVFFKLPVKKNLIVFESFLGKNYSDSPKNIYEYIQNNNLDFECVWIFNETGKNIPGNAKQVKRFSLEYYYYMAIAGYWVTNSRVPVRIKKREETVYLQTWHGTPLKKLVFDMKDILSANPNYKKDVYIQTRTWDYLIAANRYSSENFKSAFKFDKEMLELGYPRNDILYQKNNAEDISALKNKLNFPSDKKVILYAPTWRDDEFHSAGKYKFDIQLNLEKMQKELGKEYIVVLRMHYFIADNMDISAFKGFAYDYSKYDDIAELYLISDLLITDYSSVMFDFANTKRPILFYTYDLEKYRDTLRGFYFDFEKEAPGPLLKTTDEIITSILEIEKVTETYETKYHQFYDTFCSLEDGNATKRVVEKVFLKK